MSKTNKIRFYVNEETGTVVAKLTITCDDLWEEFTNAANKHPFVTQDNVASCYAKHLPFFIPYRFIFEKIFDERDEITFEGKAQCADMDLFNVGFGKSLARARLMQRVNHFKANAIQTYIRVAIGKLWHTCKDIEVNFFFKESDYRRNENALMEGLCEYIEAREDFENFSE